MAAIEKIDAIASAAQLGRLDLISAMMASIAVALVLGGIFSFINFRRVARAQARETAIEVATQIAERVAVEYVQAELPKIIEAYEQLAKNAVTAEEANEIAQAQDDGEEGG